MLAAPMVAMPGGWELLLIVFVLILLFGAKKLPDLARGTGRALRIFKTETRGLMEDDDDEDKREARDDAPRSLTGGEPAEERTEQRTDADARPQGSEQPQPTHRPYES